MSQRSAQGSFKLADEVGLVKEPYPGGKPKLSDEQKSDLAAIVAAGPEAAGFDTGVSGLHP